MKHVLIILVLYKQNNFWLIIWSESGPVFLVATSLSLDRIERASLNWEPIFSNGEALGKKRRNKTKEDCKVSAMRCYECYEELSKLVTLAIRNNLHQGSFFYIHFLILSLNLYCNFLPRSENRTFGTELESWHSVGAALNVVSKVVWLHIIV